jgi:hypothetical protein
MTEIQNSKQLAFDLVLDLDIVIWNLFQYPKNPPYPPLEKGENKFGI